MTGFYRDGCCNTGQEDVGSHTVCAVMTAEFLAFSKSRGNDLATPMPAFGFPRAMYPAPAQIPTANIGTLAKRWSLCSEAAAA
jgi:uncharacterized protein (DUF2237 family)